MCFFVPRFLNGVLSNLYYKIEVFYSNFFIFASKISLPFACMRYSFIRILQLLPPNEILIDVMVRRPIHPLSYHSIRPLRHHFCPQLGHALAE
jgi:hypothetical protein